MNYLSIAPLERESSSSLWVAKKFISLGSFNGGGSISSTLWMRQQWGQLLLLLEPTLFLIELAVFTLLLLVISCMNDNNKTVCSSCPLHSYRCWHATNMYTDANILLMDCNINSNIMDVSFLSILICKHFRRWTSVHHSYKNKFDGRRTVSTDKLSTFYFVFSSSRIHVLGVASQRVDNLPCMTMTTNNTNNSPRHACVCIITKVRSCKNLVH